jgi:ribosomal protein L11 methyltransferase
MTNSPALLFMVHARFPGTLPELLEPLLAERAPWGWQEEDVPEGVLISIHFPQESAAREMAAGIKARFPMAATGIQAVPDSDWALSWREFFQPVRAGRFLVLPPWIDPGGIDPEASAIVIEPKMAFGTGHHPTTLLCLLAIDELCPPGTAPGRTFLDLGTGSGILGIACARAGLVGVGLDIDPLAVLNAAENIVLNRVQSSFAVAAGTLDALRPGAKFDLVVSNILAHPLAGMAQNLVTRLRTPGGLILSGLLRDQEFFVTTAYTQQGLGPPRILRKGEWSALIWDVSTS